MTHKTPKIWPSVISLILLLACPASAQNYTIAPPPFQTMLDDSGAIVVAGCVWTYAAGTTNAVATYSNSSGSTNTNPIVADNMGRFTAYLLAGTNYKFVYENVPCSVSPPTHGAVLRTADNIAGTPASAANVDATGIAGETINAGLCAYLSDGSGSKTAGQWYKCDSTNTYSSSLAVAAGIVPSTIISGATGTIRLSGTVTGLSVSTASTYSAGAAGALTTTTPANQRVLGIADSTSSIIMPPPWQLTTVPRGGTGAATLTAHGVLVGEATSAVSATSAGTTGQVLTSNGASADPTFQSSGMVLLKAGSGTDTSAAATVVDSVAISGLTALDTLKVYVTLSRLTANTAATTLYNVTDGVAIYSLQNGVAIAGNWQIDEATIRRDQSSNTQLLNIGTFWTSAAASGTFGAAPTMTTGWTGSWTLGLRHGGVTATGTLRWAWAVYKVSGQ